MPVDTNKLIELINMGFSLNEIVNNMNLSRNEIYDLFRNLSSYGIDFGRKYYSSGDILYVPTKEIEIPGKRNCVDIITESGSDSFRTLVISDLHIGSIYERHDAWDIMMNYCIDKGIHNVIVAGDFLDGINKGRAECKIHDNFFEQMVYAVDKYPMDNNIIHFVTFGNHDVDSLVSEGINFATYLHNYRHDIVPVGYGYGRINIKNDRILVTHPLCIGVSNNLDLTGNYLLIKGHHHANKSIIGTNGNCSLSVPSLSDIYLTENEFLPGAIDLSIKFKNGYFDTIFYEHLLINNGRVHTISSTQFMVSPSKDRKYDGNIKYEEEFGKIRTLKKEDKH